ncbi:hypothetical protein LSAT2_030358 [Lamellibrachia satsuma]|nr:hypothetical protein LSAT2_030358 [Lamellibrachia satsuma]
MPRSSVLRQESANDAADNDATLIGPQNVRIVGISVNDGPVDVPILPYNEQDKTNTTRTRNNLSLLLQSSRLHIIRLPGHIHRTTYAWSCICQKSSCSTFLLMRI